MGGAGSRGQPPASRRSPGLESWCRRGTSGSRGSSATPSLAGCGTVSPGQPPSALRSRGEPGASGPPRASQVCCPRRMGAGRAGVVAALTRHPPGEPFLRPTRCCPHPPARTAGSDCPRAEGRLPPRPRPSRCCGEGPLPPAGGPPGARPIPGGGRTGSRCSAQRRLHPRLWSQARRGPAGGGGGIGGGILRLPRPPPRPPSSLLFHRLRAPLTGPSSWPGGASPGLPGQRRAFSGAGRGTGHGGARARGAPGQGLGPSAPQPRALEESSSRRRRSLAERPPARLATRARSGGGGGYSAERAAGAAVRAPPPLSRPPLGCRPPPSLPHPSGSPRLPALPQPPALRTPPPQAGSRANPTPPPHPRSEGPTPRGSGGRLARAGAAHWHLFPYPLSPPTEGAHRGPSACVPPKKSGWSSNLAPSPDGLYPVPSQHNGRTPEPRVGAIHLSVPIPQNTPLARYLPTFTSQMWQ